MRLAVVLIALLFTVGCSCGEQRQPAVQPQPIIEQPTYQGETQYDYKAGAPDDLTNPVQDTNNPDSGADSGYPQPAVTVSGGGSSGGWSGGHSYTQPVRRIVYAGSGMIAKSD